MRDVSIFSVLFDNNDRRAKGNIEVLDSNPLLKEEGFCLIM
jgi:hypothetical protein